MMKSILALFLSLNILFSMEKPSNEDFLECFKRYEKTLLTLEGVKAIAITKNKAASFEKPKKFIKYDPYLKLYLVSSENNLSTWFKKDERKLKKSRYIASVDSAYVSIGHLKSLGNDLGFYDQMNVNTKKGTIISGACAVMYGVGTGNNYFIGNRYLNHFVKYDDVYYGDVGVDFFTKEGKFYIKNVNPFSVGAKFLPNDEIISINGEIPKNFRDLKEKILFAEKNSIINFEILRKKERKNFNIKVQNINHFKNDYTYLGFLGMTFNKNLKLIKITNNSKAEKLGLKIGDKLLQINNKNVKNAESVKNILSYSKNYPFFLLFDRNDFQFFVRVEK